MLAIGSKYNVLLVTMAAATSAEVCEALWLDVPNLGANALVTTAERQEYSFNNAVIFASTYAEASLDGHDYNPAFVGAALTYSDILENGAWNVNTAPESHLEALAWGVVAINLYHAELAAAGESADAIAGYPCQAEELLGWHQGIKAAFDGIGSDGRRPATTPAAEAETTERAPAAVAAMAASAFAAIALAF